MTTRRTTDDRVELRLSGAGGQGLITAGVILSEAAVLDGLEVVQTQSYGPEARLGASRAEVIVARETIAYPQVVQPDVILCLSQDSFDKYIGDADDATLVIVDATNVEVNGSTNGAGVHPFPITETAIEVGHQVVANVVALGALNALAEVVSAQSLTEAVLRRVPDKHRDMNERALDAGHDLAAASAATS